MNQKTLLQPNQFYPKNTELFNIIRYLGEGRTAYVYQVLDQKGRHLALKVMHTDLNKEMQDMFKGERNNLRHLTSYLSAFDEHLTPQFYDDFDISSDEEFIAQELVQGEQIVNLEKSSGAISEKTGTIIVEKFALVLQVLHENMRKTYSDMKYQNIWWLEDEQSIRVTDWNVIDDFTDEGMKRDLLKFATYAARIFVGQMPRTQGNLITEDIRKNPNWEKLSFGTQHFLRKALHTNPKYRYQSAKEMREDLVLLTQAWSWDRNELVKSLLEYLDEAESEDERKIALAHYQRAKMLLEIANATERYRLRPGDKDEYAHRINRGISGTDFIAIGLEFYASTDYKRALENFEAGYKKGSGDIALYRRWRDLGKMAISVGEEFAQYSKIMHDAVIELNKENYSAAVRLFEVASKLDASMKQEVHKLKTESNRTNFDTFFEKYPEFSLLYIEAFAWEKFNEANKEQGNENYQEATQLYAQVVNLFSFLPEELKVFVPDIQGMKKEANRLANLGSVFTDTIAEAESEVLKGNIKEATHFYEEAYKEIVQNVKTPSLNPSDEILVPLWASILGQAEHLLQKEQYADGKEIFRLGAKYYPDNAKFSLGVWQAEELEQLTREDVISNPIKSFEAINHTLNYVRDFSSLIALKGILSERLDSTLDQLTGMGEHVLAQRLVAGATKADEKWGQDEIAGRYRAKIKIKQEEGETEIRKVLMEMDREVIRLTQMSKQDPSVDLNRRAIQEQISRTRALISQLPFTQPLDGFLKELNIIERDLLTTVEKPKTKAISKEEFETLEAAKDALAEVRGQLDLAAQKTLRASYAIWGNNPIRWYEFISEIEENIEIAEYKLNKTRQDLTKKLSKPAIQTSLIYSDLQKIDTQLAEQEKLLGNLAKGRHEKEEEKLLNFMAETQNLLEKENYAQAARVLTRMAPLAEKHPELNKQYKDLEKKYKHGIKNKFIPKKVFWLTMIPISLLLLILGMTGLFLPPIPTNTPTPISTETLIPPSPTIMPPTATVVPPTPTLTFTPTIPPAPHCDISTYPNNLIYINGKGSVSEDAGDDNLKGTVTWQYRNIGGCSLNAFALNKTASYSPENGLGFDELLTITHEVQAGKNAELTRTLSYTIDNTEFTFDLVPFKMPANANEPIILLPPATTEESIQNDEYTVLMTVVGEIEALAPDEKNFYSTGRATIAWTITNLSNLPVTLLDFGAYNAEDNFETKVLQGNAILITEDNISYPLQEYLNDTFSLESGKSITIQQTVQYNDQTKLTRILKVKAQEETDIPLSENFPLSAEIALLPKYNTE